MPRNYNWFTAVRQGRREGHAHRVPVCTRHGQMRYDEEAEGSSSSTTEDERRELERRRDRRRELRNRIREEENGRSERVKKRSTKSRICAWLNCFCGVLIVLGLIFVFYVITTLIIDGSSPLDFISFSGNNRTSIENGTTLPKSTTPAPPSTVGYKINKISQNKNNENENIEKTAGVKVSSTTPSSSRESKEVTDNTIKTGDLKFDADPESRLFRPGLEAESTDTNVKFIKGTNGRDYIAFVPVPLDRTKGIENNNYVEKKKEEIQLTSVNRNGKSPNLYRYDTQEILANHRVIRPVNQNNYNTRRFQDSAKTDSKIISHYIPPPNDRKAIHRIIKLEPSSSNEHRYIKSSIRPYETNIRRIESTRGHDSDRRYKAQEHRPHGISGPSLHRRPNTRDRFGEIPSHSVGVSVRSRPYPMLRPSNRDHSLYRDRPEDNKNYNSHKIHDRRQRPQTIIGKRPPNEYRYPPSAGNIQDIISYMNKGDVNNDKSKYYEPNYENKNQENHFERSTHPSVYHERNQEYDNRNDYNDERTVYYIKDDDPVFETSYSSEETIGSRYDVNNYNEYIDEPKNRDSSFDQSSLPPIKNTYDTYDPPFYKSKERPRESIKEKKTMRLNLDIYPSDNHSSRTNTLLSSVSFEGDTRRYDDNERFQTEDNHKKEIILHLNLYTQQPTHRSEPDLRGENSVSMEIPIRGNLSPLDIYRAFVAQARKSPVASPRRGHLAETSNQFESKIKTDGISASDGRRLFGAIEDGLRQLDSYLPSENKFSFNDVPVSDEEIVGAGKGSSDDEVLLVHNHRTER